MQPGKYPQGLGLLVLSPNISPRQAANAPSFRTKRRATQSSRGRLLFLAISRRRRRLCPSFFALARPLSKAKTRSGVGRSGRSHEWHLVIASSLCHSRLASCRGFISVSAFLVFLFLARGSKRSCPRTSEFGISPRSRTIMVVLPRNGNQPR